MIAFISFVVWVYLNHKTANEKRDEQVDGKLTEISDWLKEMKKRMDEQHANSGSQEAVYEYREGKNVRAVNRVEKSPSPDYDIFSLTVICLANYVAFQNNPSSR